MISTTIRLPSNPQQISSDGYKDWSVVSVTLTSNGQELVLNKIHSQIQVASGTLAKIDKTARVIIERSIDSQFSKTLEVTLVSKQYRKGCRVCDFVLKKNKFGIFRAEFIRPYSKRSSDLSSSASGMDSEPALKKVLRVAGPAVSGRLMSAYPIQPLLAQSYPQPAPDSPRILVVMGNSGSGKSTFLNRMLRTSHFPAGPEITTDSLSVLEHQGVCYWDTPGRANLLEETLASVNLRMHQDGVYKLLFVCSWVNEGVNPDDVAFVEAVLRGLEIKNMPFSVVVNRVPQNMFLELKKNQELRHQLLGCLSLGIHRGKTSHILLDRLKIETKNSLPCAIGLMLSFMPACSVSSGLAIPISDQAELIATLNWHRYFESKVLQVKPDFWQYLKFLEPLFLLFHKADISIVNNFLEDLFKDKPNNGQGLHRGFIRIILELRKKEEESHRVPSFGPSSGPSGVKLRPLIDPRARDPLSDDSLQLWEKEIKKLPVKSLESGLFREYQTLEAIGKMEVAERAMRDFWSRSSITPSSSSLPKSFSKAGSSLWHQIQLPGDEIAWYQHLKKKLPENHKEFQDPKIIGLLEPFWRLCNMVSISTAMAMVKLLTDFPPTDLRGIWSGFRFFLSELQEAEEMKSQESASSSPPVEVLWKPRNWRLVPRATDPFQDYAVHEHEAVEKDMKNYRESQLSIRYTALLDAGLLPKPLSPEAIHSAYEDLVFNQFLTAQAAQQLTAGFWKSAVSKKDDMDEGPEQPH